MKNNNIKKHYNIIKKVKLDFLSIFYLGITAMLVASTKFFLALLYQYIINLLPEIEVVKFSKLILLAGVLIVISSIAFRAFVRQKRITEQKITHILQQELIENKLNTSLLEWEKQDKGEWMTKISLDCSILASYFPSHLMSLFRGGILFGLGLVYGLKFSYKLTLIILICSLASIIVPKIFLHTVKETQSDKQLSDETVRNHIIESLNSISIIKAYHAEDFFVKLFKKFYKEYSNNSIENVKAKAKIESVNVGIGFLMNTIWMITGVYMIMINDLSIGTFVGFMTLSDSFNWPFFELPQILGDLSNAIVSYDRLYGQKIDKKEVGEIVQVNNVRNELCVQGISFGYFSDTKFIFNNLDLNFEKGTQTVLVGESGKGKSTLLKLLSGLYDVKKGDIAYYSSGVKYTGKYIRDKVSYVPQENIIFTDSIIDNLRYGKENATIEEIKEATRLANADSFISELPEGYNTIIGDNSETKLSVGQLQRIALARAFLKNADIYILDEITSALDELNEKVVLNSIKEKADTLIMVAHKTSVIEYFEKIIEV